MSEEEKTVLMIKGAITELGAAEREACEELCEHIRMAMRAAGEPTASLAIALIGAEKQLDYSK